MTAIWIRDLAAIALQLGIVAAAGGIVAWVFRLRAPRVALAYWQALLLACLVLPFAQPRQDTPPASAMAATTSIVEPGTRSAHLPTAMVSSPSLAIEIGTWIVLGLAAGLTARLLWLLLGALKLRQLRQSATPLEPLPAAFRSAQDTLGTSAEIGVSPHTSGPVTFGLRRPMVLLPPAFTTMPPHVQEAIAYHELLHVRRRDWLCEVVEEGIRTIFWWHPGIWFLIGRIQLAREQVVDQTTIGLTRARDHYVDALLLVALAKSPRTLVPAPLFLRKSLLKQRVAQIFQESTMTTRQLIASLSASAVALVAAATVAVYAFPLETELQQRSPVSETEPVQILSGGEDLLHGPVPKYPHRAIEQRVEGDVVLEVALDERGEVSDARVVSGPDELRKAALSAVLYWHFSPVRRQSTTMTVTLRFKTPPSDKLAEFEMKNGKAEWKTEDLDGEKDRAQHVLEELEKAMADHSAPPELRETWKHRYQSEKMMIEKLREVDSEQKIKSPMTLAQIRAERVPESLVKEIVAHAGLRIGEPVTDDLMKRLREAATSIDEHMEVVLRPNRNGGAVLNFVVR
jgi:TonB family protein